MAVKSNDKLVATINKNFIIRWKLQDEKKTQLVSAGQYYKIVGGRERSEKHFSRALNSTGMKYTILVKNHLKIDFIVK